MNGHLREQRAILGHLSDAGAQDHAWGLPGDFLAEEGDRSRLRLDQPADDAEHRALAGAIRPDDAGDGPFFDLQIETLEDESTTVAGLHISHREDDLRHHSPPACGPDRGRPR